MKKNSKVTCPACGTEFGMPKKELPEVAILVGMNSGLGNVCSCTVAQEETVKLPQTAQERIEALRAAGVDVTNMIALKGTSGGEYIFSNKDGKLAILEEDDPIFNYITNKGAVPNRKLFRRFVMAQMFHMMTYVPSGQKNPAGVTYMINRLGYEYQWKMLMNELYAQTKMEGKDNENFRDRNRWFNINVVNAMAEDYRKKLYQHIKNLPVKSCKGLPYKHIGGKKIFVTDIQSKLYNPLNRAIRNIANAKNATQLYNAAMSFNKLRVKLKSDTSQCKQWMDAYKGSGAYFTMQNMIRFHKCLIFNEAGFPLDKQQSLEMLSYKAELHSNGEGWKMLGILKKMLADNNINVKKKVTEWRKKK